MDGTFGANLRKLARLPSSGYVTLLPYQTPQVENLFLRHLPPVNVKSILDMTAHIGGDALHFSRLYPDASITAIEWDVKVFECLQKNIAEYAPDPKKYTLIYGDSVSYLRDRKPYADLIYIDPPWGGPGYSENKELSLVLGTLPLEEVCLYILREKLTSNLVLKVPKNFAYSKLKNALFPIAETSLHYVHKLQKNGSIAYGLIFIKPCDREAN